MTDGGKQDPVQAQYIEETDILFQEDAISSQ